MTGPNSSKSDNTINNPTAKLRFPEFLGSSPWSRKVGGELFTNRKEVGEEGLPIYSVTVNDGMVPRASFDRDFYDIADSACNRKAYKGDIVYNMMRMWQGAQGVAPEDCMVSPAYVVLKPRKEVCAEFFAYFFKLPQSLQVLTATSRGLTKDRLRLYFDDFARMRMSAPDHNEQRRIASCLASMDELILAEGQKLDALKDHKKGLMQQLFPREGETLPRLRLPEFQNAGDWERKPLAELVEVASGQVDPKEEPYCRLLHVGGENIESRTGDLQNLKSAREDAVISGKYLFDETYVLYSKIRPALNKVAVPTFSGVCSADIYPIRPSSSELIRAHLLYLLRSESFVTYAVRNSERGKIPKINREALLAYFASVPKPAEQQRIAACLSSLDDLIASQANRIQALRTHKQGLMQQLFPSPVNVFS
ncbi:MAG: restriction endonuclease subunit S [Xanthomonadales bacterium]|nr:restriction endonuclease subunit S [Xanthomonadales bacterium]MCB1643595.1 restriction endonuclease subunit S [Xanthomonadales bacterium]